MASGEHSCTRRAVLGAAVAVSFDGLRMSGEGVGVRSGRISAGAGTPHPYPSPPGEGKWRSALAAFRRAELAKERFGEASRGASAPAGGRAFEAQEGLDEKYADFVGAAEAAMMRLVETPAPDLDALAAKIALIGEHLVWELGDGEACLDWLEADARRLAGLGRSEALTQA